MSNACDLIELALQQFLRPYGLVKNLRVMADGHAGLAFGFDLVNDGVTKQFILKKGPDGVPRSGAADICRQAPVLHALAASGFPAPDVPWVCEDESILGAPFIIMSRLPGRSTIVWESAPHITAQFEDPSATWTETARLMGQLHSFDWQANLKDWEMPTDFKQELDRWTRLLRHMPDDESLAGAQELGRSLAASIPAHPVIGLVHGDLQPGNVLFDGGRAQGLIDWDLVTIAPLGLDVGWLLMVGDTENWAPNWLPFAPPSRDALVDAYHSAGGPPVDNLAWCQAFAGFRNVAITGLNLKLHRDGRRPDPVWEDIGLSIPRMLKRARSVLEGG